MPLTLVKRANGIYHIRGTLHGKSIYRTTGTREETTAQRILAKAQAELTEEHIEGPIAVATFQAAAIAYVGSGAKGYRIFHEKADGRQGGLSSYFGATRLKDIGQVELDACAQKLCPNGSPATRNREVYTPFIAMWNYAVQNGWAREKKWRRPRQKRAATGERRKVRAGTTPVSYETAWQFVRHMSPAAASLMTLLFYTGMRPIEAFTLTRDDVHIEDRWIVLSGSKTGEARGVPMHEMLVPMLTALKAREHAQPHLFMTQKNAPYQPKDEGEGGGQMKSAIIGARKRSGLAGIAPYTARHTVSTQLVLNGVHPYVKDQILGHAATDMSRRYTSVPQKPLIDAINTLPVISEWAAAEWMTDPVAKQRRLARKRVKA